MMAKTRNVPVHSSADLTFASRQQLHQICRRVVSSDVVFLVLKASTPVV